jgi:hypothetical protein
MKNGIYTLLAVGLLIGAILYSNSVVMGKSPDTKRPSPSPSVTHAKLTSKKKPAHNNSNNSAQAGANAAKPNGVPNCVACAPENDNGSSNDSNTGRDDLAEAPEPGPSSSGQPPPVRSPRPTHQNTTVHQQAHAKAVAKGRSASAKAIAVNNTTINNVTHTTVQRVQRIQPIETEEPVSTPVSTEVPLAEVEQPVAVETQPVATQIAAVPVSRPLPATGNLALSGLIGTSAIGAAAYSYIQSRRRLVRSSRKRPK